MDNSTLILYLEVAIRKATTYFCDWKLYCGIASIETVNLLHRVCRDGSVKIKVGLGLGLGGRPELLHQHVCSNVIARPRRTKKTRPAL